MTVFQHSRSVQLQSDDFAGFGEPYNKHKPPSVRQMTSYYLQLISHWMSLQELVTPMFSGHPHPIGRFVQPGPTTLLGHILFLYFFRIIISKYTHSTPEMSA